MPFLPCSPTQTQDPRKKEQESENPLAGPVFKICPMDPEWSGELTFQIICLNAPLSFFTFAIQFKSIAKPKVCFDNSIQQKQLTRPCRC